MKMAIRRVVGVALAGCVLLGPSLAGAASAQASTARTNALPPDPCSWGYDDGHTGAIPTARKPGVRLRQWIPVRNHQSIVIPNAYVNFLTLGDVQRRAPLPSVWWRAAGGQWKRAMLTWVWNSPGATHFSHWLSSNLELGSLPPRATKWFVIDVYFPAHSIKGVYTQYFSSHSHSCSPQLPLTQYTGGVTYWPWRVECRSR